MRSPRRTFTLLFSVAMVLLGAALVVRTVVSGGGPVAQGVLVGALFVAAGVARIWLETKRTP